MLSADYVPQARSSSVAVAHKLKQHLAVAVYSHIYEPDRPHISSRQKVEHGRASVSCHPDRGLSSAGRAPDLHSGGQEFDPPRLHHQVRWAVVVRIRLSVLRPTVMHGIGSVAQVVRAHA